MQGHHTPAQRAPGDVHRGVAPAHFAVPLVEGEPPAREPGDHCTPAVNPDLHPAGAEVLHPETVLGPDVTQLVGSALEAAVGAGDEEIGGEERKGQGGVVDGVGPGPGAVQGPHRIHR